MVREIVLDTETTGFEPSEGHRLLEIGCVELINHLPTGNVFHKYVNPTRDIPEEAARVHGLTTQFLQDKPIFSEIVGEFLDFIAEDILVIHNAQFDMKFLNSELTIAGFKILPMKRSLDTLTMARKKFPGQPANLDSLCRRFKVDNSGRDFHGALLDAELLSEVYLELIGGRQHGLGFGKLAKQQSEVLNAKIKRQKRKPREFPLKTEDLDEHKKFIEEKIKESIWAKN